MTEETRGDQISGPALAGGIGSIAIAGNNLAPVNTAVFVGQWYSLTQAYFDPTDLGSEIQPDSFVGREWLIREIDDYIANNSSGYFIIEADAGMGKTSFAWHLAMRGAHPCHISRIDPRARRTAEAVRNISAQMIAAWGLNDLAPQGMLPPGSDRPIWLRRVISEVALRRNSIDPSKHVLIVVDSLDEAECRSDEMPYGLPTALPDGVYIVATTRTGTALPALRHPYRVRLISAQEADNRWDMVRYLSEVTQTAAISDRLNNAPIDIKDFNRMLAERCAGVWIYLHYVLAEVRYGLRKPEQVGSIPADLESYYTQNFSVLRVEEAWYKWYLPLLSTLCAAVEPLDVDQIAYLAGISDVASVRNFLFTRFRPFCEVISSSDHDQFRLYHTSLKEYLAGKTETQGLTADLSMRRELHEASLAAHSRIADVYLTSWGGLDFDLQSLANDLRLSEVHSGYGLRNVIFHLDSACRYRDVDRLLAVEAGGRNLWFEAHLHHADTEGYLRDIDRASLVSRSGGNPGEATAQLGGASTMEFRYALMAASVASRASRIPFALVKALVLTGAWTQSQCLEHIRHIYERDRRATAYVRALPYLTGWRRMAAEKEALAAVMGMEVGPTRSAALLELARLLPRDGLGSILAEVRSSGTPNKSTYRLEVIRLMANHLPDELVSDALNAALELTGSDLGMAITALAPRLTEPDIPYVLRAMPELPEDVRSRCIAAVAQALSIAPFIEEVIDLAEGIETPEHRAAALAALAPRVPEPGRAQVENLAVRAARAVELNGMRARSLITVASSARDGGDRRLLGEEALTAVAEIRDVNEHVEVLAAGCSLLGGNQWQNAAYDAVAKARLSEDVSMQIFTVSTLAPLLPTVEGSAAAKRALNLVTPIFDREEQAHAIASLIRGCVRNHWENAATVIGEISDDFTRVNVLVELVSDIPRESLAKIVESIDNIKEYTLRLQLVAAIAPYAPPDCFAKMFQVIGESDLTSQDRTELARMRRRRRSRDRRYLAARSRFVSRRPEDFPGGSQQVDFASLDDLDVEHLELTVAERRLLKRVHALDSARLQVLSSAAARQGVIMPEKALTIARAMYDPAMREQALASLIETLDRETQVTVLQEVLTWTTRSRDLLQWIALLGRIKRANLTSFQILIADGLADAFLGGDFASRSSFTAFAEAYPRSVPQVFVNRLLTRVLQIKDLSVRIKELRWVFQMADSDALRVEIARGALNAAREISQRPLRCVALIDVMSLLSEGEQKRAAREALRCAFAVESESDRVCLFAQLLPYLDSATSDETLQEMIVTSTTIVDRRSRCRALVATIPVLSGATRSRVVADTLRSAAGINVASLRADALVDLAPVIGRSNFAEALTIASSIPDENSLSRVLCSFAPWLGEDSVAAALIAALSIKNERSRVDALVALLPRAAFSDVLDVCGTVDSLYDGSCRVRLLRVGLSVLHGYEASGLSESRDVSEWSPFRRWIRGLNRAAMLSVTEASHWWLGKVGGNMGVLDAARAIVDAGRWWP